MLSVWCKQSLRILAQTDISSQKSKVQTHLLVLLLIRPMTENDSSDGETETFTRLKKTNIKDTVIRNTVLLLSQLFHHYTGPKEVNRQEVKSGVFSTEMMEQQAAIKKRSQELELEFFQAIAAKPVIPEHSDYNTK